MKIKVDIFSGFLGAGKTMLIKKLISESLSSDNIVIIENEFGQVGIDGSILKRTNIKVKEINAGCICCSISGDFKKAIMEIVTEYSPARIIIEPSGVAKLSEVLNVFKEPKIKELVNINMVTAVVDVLKYDIYIANFNEFYSDQIKSAKTVVLSRTQSTSEDKVKKVVDSIKKINNRASIVTTPWDSLPSNAILAAGEQDFKKSLDIKVNLIKRPMTTVTMKMGPATQKVHRADQVFQSWGYETPKIFNTTELKFYLKRLGEESSYGKVLRAKGILQVENNKWIQFDYVPDELAIRETTADYTGRLCVIGSNLSYGSLERLFLNSNN